MQHPNKFYLSDVPIYKLMYALHNNNTGMPTSQRRNQKNTKCHLFEEKCNLIGHIFTDVRIAENNLFRGKR